MCASLTRYAVLASQPPEHLPRRLRTSRDYIGEPSFCFQRSPGIEASRASGYAVMDSSWAAPLDPVYDDRRPTHFVPPIRPLK